MSDIDTYHQKPEPKRTKIWKIRYLAGSRAGQWFDIEGGGTSSNGRTYTSLKSATRAFRQIAPRYRHQLQWQKKPDGTIPTSIHEVYEIVELEEVEKCVINGQNLGIPDVEGV